MWRKKEKGKTTIPQNFFEATTNNHEADKMPRRPKNGLLGTGRPIFPRTCKKTINFVVIFDKKHDNNQFYIYNRNKNQKPKKKLAKVLPHSSTVIFSLSQEWEERKCFSQTQFSTDHAHLFISGDTPCEFQSDRPPLDFWPKSCRTA